MIFTEPVLLALINNFVPTLTAIGGLLVALRAFHHAKSADARGKRQRRRELGEPEVKEDDPP